MKQLAFILTVTFVFLLSLVGVSSADSNPDMTHNKRGCIYSTTC